METGKRKVGIEIAVPSCACCSAKIEEEVGAALGVPSGTVKLAVPVMAQLFYDPAVVELDKIIELLRWRGYSISVDRVQYGIPLRPLFLPHVWKTSIETLSKEVQGVVFASINFVRSVIAVDYVPALVRPEEILDALLGRGSRHLESRKLGIKADESIHTHHTRGANPDPKIVRSHCNGSLFSVGAGFSRHCHNNNGLESMVAQA